MLVQRFNGLLLHDSFVFEDCPPGVIFIYLLNMQLVQDIIKNIYTHRNEKKDIKHSGKSIHT